MLGATAARTKYKSATTTQNIGTSRRPPDPGASPQGKLGGAELGNLDQYPVARGRILDRNHAAGHHDHAAASLFASQLSALSGWPITSLPIPCPISRPLIESRAVCRARSSARQFATGVPSTTPALHTLPATIA